MRPLALLAAVVAPLVGTAAAAHAGPDGLVGAPTVIGVPTAWIQPAGAAHVSGDVDHHLGSGVRVTKSLGRLAEVDVGSDDQLTTCDPCAGEDRATGGLQLVSAGFKLAAWEGAGFRHQPALAVGVHAPITSTPPTWTASAPRATEGFVIASKTLGPVRLHLGASAWATEHRGRDGRSIRTGGLAAPRPLAAVEWTPAIYPRTTLSTDVQWVPELGPTRAETGPRWLFGWGVRYRAFAWSAIELAVKHRQGDDLSGATVTLRLSARIGRGTRF